MKNKPDPLKILLANYRYHVSGGSERYFFGVKKLLEERGHQVVPFSVAHPRNEPSSYSSYFLSPLTKNPDALYYREIEKHPRNIVRLFGRTFYSFEARRNVERLLKNHPVDIAYVLHFLRWISPSLIDALHAHRIPVVTRLSDFAFLCPEVHFLRNGRICELCAGGNLWHSVRYRCVQSSFPISLLNAFSVFFHRSIGILDSIDAIVCPSRFLYNKMAQAGFSMKKLHHIPSFIDQQQFIPATTPGSYVLYFGRISREKGVEVLVDAFAKLKSLSSSIRLVIVGFGSKDAMRTIHERILSAHLSNVQFEGGMSGDALFTTIRNAAFVVVPSICYENMPQVVLESYAHGKPVIASNLGSLPEVVDDQVTGCLFQAGNAEDLSEKIASLSADQQRLRDMGEAALERVRHNHSPNIHYQTLMDLFSRLREDF